MASAGFQVTVNIDPEEARRLATEIIALRAELAALTAPAACGHAGRYQYQDGDGAGETSCALCDLADMTRLWAADVGTLTARAKTVEARATALERDLNAALAEAARYAEALAKADPWTNDIPFNCVYCDAVWDANVGSSENQHNDGCVWIAATLRGPAQAKHIPQWRDVFKVDTIANIGDNWMVADFGADADGKHYILTTDHLHASEAGEFTEGAKADAELVCKLLNDHYRARKVE